MSDSPFKALDNLDDLLVAEDLELDFSDAELIKAQEPLLPDADSGPEATRLLTEAPWPSGASLDNGGDLEPVLAMAGELSPDQDLPGVGPPSFFPRLGLGTAGPVKVEPVAEMAWSLASGESWPVFIQRLHMPRFGQAAWLKRVALAARRHAENRLCLGPSGELDVFFNDRGSLARFQREIQGAFELSEKARLSGPVRVMSCRGLLSCPWAAIDSISAADKLIESLAGHRWPDCGVRKRSPLFLAVRACQAGSGLACGVFEYSDLILTGRRRSWPVIDQDIASLSPRISRLIIGCPGRALKRSHLPGIFVDLDHGACQRCGWCVSQDPAFTWPDPQGGYFSLELSGRRQAPPWEHVPAMALSCEAGGDLVEISAKILSLIDLWRRDAAAGEILVDFASRRGLLESGGDGPAATAPPPSN